VGFEVLTALTMKSAVSWYVTSCGLVDVYRCFEDKAKQVESKACLLLAVCLVFSSILKMEVVDSCGTSVNIYKTA
jgi:hypothetical protein